MWPEIQRTNGRSGARRTALRAIRSSIDLFGQKPERLILNRLNDLKAPLMTIWGEQDQIIPVSHAQALREILPDSLVYTIPECGHWPQMEHAERFNGLLIQFLGDRRPSL